MNIRVNKCFLSKSKYCSKKQTIGIKQRNSEKQVATFIPIISWPHVNCPLSYVWLHA